MVWSIAILIFAGMMVYKTRKRRRRYRTNKTPRIQAPRSSGYPYLLAISVLTPCELRFFETLRMAMPDGMLLLMKVRMADVLVCPAADWASHGWKVSNRHFDFVLVDAQTLAPVLAIELDDSSHDARKAKARDRFVDSASAACGLRVLHVRASAGYDTAALAKVIRDAV